MSDTVAFKDAVGAEVVQSDKVVLYHAGCVDGFCAAWLMKKVYPDAIYLPIQYGDGVPPQCAGRDVVIVDFSFKRPVLLELASTARSVLVLDHHKTAEAELVGLPNCFFDMNKSGARLVQEFYNLPPHWLVDYTEDRDLWLWKLEESRAVNAAIRLEPFEFATWDAMSNHSPSDLAAVGRTILRYQQQLFGC